MHIDGTPYRTIFPDPDGVSVQVIDQTRLPFAFELKRLATLDDAALAIRTMIVRGAPLIGARQPVQPIFTMIVFLWVKCSSIASSEASLPRPLDFTPP